MNRFFLTKEHIQDENVRFPVDINHQILHVLRLREGDEVSVLDNQGHTFLVRLQVNRDTGSVLGRIVAEEPVNSEPTVQVSLCFGLSSRDKVELILQKATEVGVSAFFPFISSRTLVQRTALSGKKVERWERIIREAAEQSGRGHLPELHRPMELEVCVQKVMETHAKMLVAWEEAESSQSDRLAAMQLDEVDALSLIVGPEGGFSRQEIRLIRNLGGEVVSLGRRILRMETAAIVFPALVLQLMGEM